MPDRSTSHEAARSLSDGSAGIPAHDLIVLAGGGGSRLGGVDKSALEVGGQSLLERVLQGAADARRVVVVGAVAVPEGVLQTVEDPPGGGPVAGITAGLATLATTGRAGSAPWTLVLAVDQPEAALACADLLIAAAAAGPEIDMVCPQDETGHPQWLLAAYRTASLAAALEPFGTGHGASVRRLVARLRSAEVTTTHVGDIDTWDDHAAWQHRLQAD